MSNRQIFKRPDLLSTMEVWAPKYSNLYGEEGEWCALIPVYKVNDASPYFIIKWTKAKHLVGLRHCIKRTDAQSYPITNVKNKQGGVTPMYTIPMSKLDTWETLDEIKQTVEELFFSKGEKE